MKRPKAKPAAYSTIKSIHMGKPSVAVMAAAAMIPVASPATQCTVEPTPCFHRGLMNSSCVPGPRFLIAHHVQRQSDWTHVQGDQDPAPLHHQRFGIVPELVPSHVHGGEGREQ